MTNPIRVVVQDFGWIHIGLGLVGNITFVVGSVFFLPALQAYMTLGVWLFIVGSALMAIGSLGELLVRLLPSKE